jgi:DeoR family transcriptional regulator of aga operon
VTGGVARSESYELVGPIAEASLANLNLDIVFVGADGVSLSKPHHPPRVEARTNRARSALPLGRRRRRRLKIGLAPSSI